MDYTINNLKEIELRKIEMPLVHPFETSFGIQTENYPILVKVTDRDGNVGWGDTTVTRDPSYCYETTETAWYIQQKYLIPLLKEHQDKLTLDSLRTVWDPIRGHEFAKGGIEAALFALIAEQQNTSLGEIYGSKKDKIPTGVSIGIQKDKEMLFKRIQYFVDQGYRRIKMKIKPGWDVNIIAAVRKEFGDLPIMVDANSAYTLDDISVFQEMDQYELMMIEQPLAYNDTLAHKKLQDQIETAVCLDESIHDPHGAKLALEFGCCKIINIKPGRVGGFGNAIKIAEIGGQGAVWCGGMLESGIGRLHNVFLQARDEFILPGDTSGSNRYYAHDVVNPAIEVDDQGYISLPNGPGLGHEIDTKRIEEVTYEKLVVDLTY